MVEVGFLCPRLNVHLDTTVLEELKVMFNTSVLVDTNVQREALTLYLVKLDIIKMRQGNQPAEFVHLDFIAMIPMAQSSHMERIFALKVITAPVGQGMLKSLSALQGHSTTELEWMRRLTAWHVLDVLFVMNGVLSGRIGCVVLDTSAVKVPTQQRLILGTRQTSALKDTIVLKVLSLLRRGQKSSNISRKTLC